MRTAPGVAALAPSMSTTGNRPFGSSTSQYSPSGARRSKRRVKRLKLWVSLKTSVAGATTTAVGSKCGSQISGAMSERRSGSIRKSQPPARRRSLGDLFFVGNLADCCSKLALIVGIASKEFPREFCGREIVQIGIGGRRPPIHRWWHMSPAICVSQCVSESPAHERIACKCGRITVRESRTKGIARKSCSHGMTAISKCERDATPAGDCHTTFMLALLQ